ncbi:M28 family peptidase [Deinococcus yavapaiensis]|uniref:PA domain-containing protein n=1 Tax=Deinococcus yavapaiensis KR-236 TaxID=694435 RepID=A0A318S3S7_9DEIO|nr:M28 family peptidase [Deinococcus yavapaiensis]PYE52710.1 PA domain-containing protein [Deinococcus yavapaiensis KR-236]
MLTDAEQATLDAITLDAPWELIERFSRLKREDPADVRTAADLLVARLTSHGVPVHVHRPELYLSIPRSASIRLGDQTLHAKAMAMSASLPGGHTAPLVHQPSVYAADADEMFSKALFGDAVDVRGKIVVTEGFGMPGKVGELEERGALGVIAVNPGDRAHWGICTSIWGTPDLDGLPRKPNIPVVSVNRHDGALLIDAAHDGQAITLFTHLDEGWFESPIPVVTIPGREDPDAFVLLHGHYDSWDVGVGDNAVGDATLLEIARVLWERRSELRRTVKIAWWPGHSTGRYAGSTWFSDTFALELHDHCVAQVNCDSPGCRDATEYRDVSWMPEAERYAQAVIRDVTGQESFGERPPRAGDYSFNNIGLTGYFMLLSTMPNDLRAEKGYYAVGGCGGNIAWHTEDDTIDVANKDILLKDMRIYALGTLRAANATTLPFDYTLAVDDLTAAVTKYQAAAKSHFDFSRVHDELTALKAVISELDAYAATLDGRPLTDDTVRRVNAAYLTVTRLLTRVNFTRQAPFFHDPAISVPPLPDLAVALDLANVAPDKIGFHKTHLTRGQNRVIATLRDAARAVRAALPTPAPTL